MHGQRKEGRVVGICVCVYVGGEGAGAEKRQSFRILIGTAELVHRVDIIFH